MTRMRSGIATLLLFAIVSCGSDVTAPKVQVPTALLVLAGDAQTVVVGSAVTTAPKVRLIDADGVAIAGAAVTFSVGSGGGSITGATATTDATGVANVGGWTLGTTAGANTLVATSGSLTATFNASGTAGKPISIAVVTGDNQSAPAGTLLPIQPSVAVRDTFANPVPGVAVTFQVMTGGGTVTGSIATTEASGIARVTTWTLGSGVGANTLAATAGIISATFTATSTVGAVAKLAAMTGNNQTGHVGAPVDVAPSVLVTDAFNNPVPNAAVTFTTANGAAVTGGSQVTNASGIATIAGWTLGSAAGNYSLQATVGNVSATFTATAIAPSPPPAPPSAPSPPASLATVRFTALASGIVGSGGGAAHTCALDANGAAYCWGGNATGELGDGTTTTRNAAVVVSGGLNFTQISVGYSHTCGLTSAGAAYCWGDNSFGQIGVAGSGSRTAPVAVSGGLTFKTLAAGGYFTCGLTQSGSAYCWGFEFLGRLGNGSGDALRQNAPVAVSGGLTFASLSAGFSDACGVTVAGVAYCWGGGSPYWGTIGDGTPPAPEPRPADDPLYVRYRAVPTAVLGGITFSKISTGSFSTCGLDRSGTAYCWGYNVDGQLGDGTNIPRGIPTVVFSTVKFVDITVGGQHTCGITTTGATLCWGMGYYGQFGDGQNASARVPQFGALGLTLTSVSAGQSTTCGIDTSAHIYCWGRNDSGQVGDGTIGVDRSRPVPVIFP